MVRLTFEHHASMECANIKALRNTSGGGGVVTDVPIKLLKLVTETL